MPTITHSQLQQLVKELPETKLPLAYRLLVELGEGHADADTPSPQLAFMRLPLQERRRSMAQQAEAMVAHYQDTAGARQEWQAGDIINGC